MLNPFSIKHKGLQVLGYLHNGMKQLSSSAEMKVPTDLAGNKFRIMSSDVLAAQFHTIDAYFIAVFGYRDIGPLKNTQWCNAKESLANAVTRNIMLMGLALLKSVTDKEVRRVILDSAKISIMLLLLITITHLFR